MCMQSPCEEDADEATGAESSSDEGENVGPGSTLDPPPPNKNFVRNSIQYIMKLQLYRIMNNLLFVLPISLLFLFLCIIM